MFPITGGKAELDAVSIRSIWSGKFVFLIFPLFSFGFIKLWSVVRLDYGEWRTVSVKFQIFTLPFFHKFNIALLKCSFDKLF